MYPEVLEFTGLNVNKYGILYEGKLICLLEVLSEYASNRKILSLPLQILAI